MYKLLSGILLFSVAAMIGLSPVMAQEKKPVKQDKIAAKDEDEVPVEKKEATVKKSRTYSIGEIVIKEKALASVEDAAISTVLSAEDLKSRSEKTLDQALQTVPGMIVRQGQKGQMNFDMRGFQHNTIALLVDGLPFEEVYDGGGGDISRINIMNASKIVINRGTSSALNGSRGAFGSINVISMKPERLFFKGSTEFDQYGGFTANAAGGGTYKNFFFTLSASVIKNNSFNISSQLGQNKRMRWLYNFVPFYVYGATSGSYSAATTALTSIGLEYILDTQRWNHNNSIKYYASGKAGYSITDNIEFGISTDYYEGSSKFNGFELSSYSAYNLDGTWSDPSAGNMVQNRAWEWTKDYRLNVAPYLKLDFGDFDMRAIYYFNQQSNSLTGWTNQAETAMFDGGKLSEHKETSHGFYIYPSYKFAEWNKLNAVVHYRLDLFEKYKKRIAAFAPTSGFMSLPNYQTPWFKTAEVSAKYVTVAIEDEFKFNTDGGDVKFSLGISYDAQMLSRNFGGRLNYFTGAPAVTGWKEDITGMLRPRLKPHPTSTLWGTGDGFNPVFSFVYEPVKEMLKLRGTLSQKTKFPTLHQYTDLADYIDRYATTTGQAIWLPLIYKLNELKPETSYNGNAGFELSFFKKALDIRGDYFYAFYRNKLESIRDPNSAVGRQSRYVNVKGREVHGMEGSVGTTLGTDKLKVVELNASLTYVFTHARDWFDNPVVKGRIVERTPAHQVIMQIKLDFISGTGINLWSNSLFNQSLYVQQFPTSVLGARAVYTTKVYTTKLLHNPTMLNIRVSQRIVDHFTLWVMCKNVTDDYNADPFNPGPGRTWYFGGDAEF